MHFKQKIYNRCNKRGRYILFMKQIRKIYPQAYIREYHQGKSGGAIDMNIDHIRIKNQIYDER